MTRLAIITTHPIQYNAPLFKLLSERGKIEIKVFYTWGNQVLEKKFDPGFGKDIQWDIPLLEGYEYEFVENVSKDPGSHHFKGINNPNLVNVIKEWKADALLVYGWSFKSHLKVMRYFKGKILVLFRGDSILKDQLNPFKKIIKILFLKWVYKKLDQALYVGTNNRNYYRAVGLKEHQLVFVPHAIENERFVSEEDKINEAKKLRFELGIKLNSVVFLFAGKLEPKKNCKLLIRSFKRILNENTDLIIVGSGNLGSDLRLLAGGQNNIHFLEFQNQQRMPVIYQLSDIFVLPSKGPGETWGLSINEAMASGKPVLVSDACGAAIDLVQNGINGYIFRSDNEMDLMDKMDMFLKKSKSDLEKMGEASREIIKDWNYENDCKAIESLLI